MEATTNIYKQLAEANKGITAIAKGQKNQQQGFMYRGIDDLYNDIHKVLADNEIFITTEILKYDIQERTNMKGTTLFTTRAEVKHTYYTTDGSSVSTLLVGEAMDSGDKGMNKAVSIALKYSLMQMFTIPTQEAKDPDAETHEVKGVTKQEMEGLKSCIQKVQDMSSLSRLFNSLSEAMRNNVSVQKLFGDKKNELQSSKVQ